MPTIHLYYHDPIEVDPKISWTGLCSDLINARRFDISSITDQRVTRLFEYARPDAVITVDGEPVVSIEQTAMNPSGHNIPQRFSFHVRAAELGIPSILYYPEYARRVFSDPNVRYLNIRVPLGQSRLSAIYNIPALTVFWPTDERTKLPKTGKDCHIELANLVNLILANHNNLSGLTNSPVVHALNKKMDDICIKYQNSYARNQSVRDIFPKGLPSSKTKSGLSIDPPGVTELIPTEEFIERIKPKRAHPQWNSILEFLSSRKFTMIFHGTANHSKSDSEHPWPGYLSLVDILYLRNDQGRATTNRHTNLIYFLPVDVNSFIHRVNSSSPPTATYIVDTFADVLLLSGGFIPGKSIRGNNKAEIIK